MRAEGWTEPSPPIVAEDEGHFPPPTTEDVYVPPPMRSATSLDKELEGPTGQRSGEIYYRKDSPMALGSPGELYS